MATKKTTKTPAKKTPVRKISVKKSTPKPSASASTKPAACAVSCGVNIWFFIALLLLGALIGSFFYDLSPQITREDAFQTDQKIVRFGGQTYVSVKNLDEDFLVELGKEDNSQLVVYGGKTWLPVDGKPVEVMVLNDKTCVSCNPEQGIDLIKQNVTPALLAREVDVTSAEGKMLIEKFGITGIPQFIFTDGVKELEVGVNPQTGKKMKFIESAKEVLVEKDGLYLLNGAKVGMKPGQYLEAPKFDVAAEPTQGKGGKVRVVEFTDYECPYCKRLHDNNKDLIAKLAKEGKIEYVLKDFPLAFHKESISAHKAANCVLREEGNDTYWKMNAKIFENAPSWSGKGIEVAKKYFISLAKDLDVDIADCIEDSTLDGEIAADIQEGQKYGVSGTPALFIGKKVMPGAIDAKTFEAAVEAALKE